MNKLDFKRVLYYFEYLSSVPHPSGQTKEISDLVVKFAKEKGLDFYQDSLNNVIIYKNATEGYEGKSPVILEAHLDMVCVAEKGKNIDMTKQAITLVNDGEWLSADGTSLGGDDISGCAIMLAILENDLLRHPSLECIFTVDEETGMYGAAGLDYSRLHGNRMINLDSEEAGVVTAGCAGGTRMECSLPIERESRCCNYIYKKLIIDGLLGGHSAESIDRERGHSHFLMARMLYSSLEKTELKIVDYRGGKFDNVIPTRTDCIVAVTPEKEQALYDMVKEYREIYSYELALSDPGVRINIEDTVCELSPLTRKASDNLLSLLISLPYGLINKSLDIEGMTQTSLNMGIINSYDDRVDFTFLDRSNVDNQRLFLDERIKNIVRAFGGKAEKGGSYNSWQFARNSEIRDIATAVSYELYSIESKITATHGGLECGYFSKNIKGLDCISIGPDILDIHSEKEKMNLDSFDKASQIVAVILERL